MGGKKMSLSFVIGNYPTVFISAISCILFFVSRVSKCHLSAPFLPSSGPDIFRKGMELGVCSHFILLGDQGLMTRSGVKLQGKIFNP